MREFSVEWHPTTQLWVADMGCGCAECLKGFGKTKEEAIADLEERLAERFAATGQLTGGIK